MTGTNRSSSAWAILACGVFALPSCLQQMKAPKVTSSAFGNGSITISRDLINYPDLNAQRAESLVVYGGCMDEKKRVQISIPSAGVSAVADCDNGAYEGALRLGSLPDGDLPMELRYQNFDGPAIVAMTLNKDTVPPTEVEIVEPAANFQITQANAEVTEFPVSGRCSEAGGEVALRVDGGSVRSLSPIVCIDGFWQGKVNLAGVRTGSHRLSAILFDAAKNFVVSDDVAFSQDILAPTLTLARPRSIPAMSQGPALVNSNGIIQIDVQYADAAQITLSPEDVLLRRRRDAFCETIDVSVTGANTRRISLSDCTGNGAIAISLVPGTAVDDAENLAGPSGFSDEFSVDTTAPETILRAQMNWREGRITSATALLAQWRPSAASDLVSQGIQFFADGGCDLMQGTAQVLSKEALSRGLTGANGRVYSFQVFSQDRAGNIATSECSNSLEVDLVRPLAATSPVWEETSPTSQRILTAGWIRSASADLKAHRVHLYRDGTCTTPTGFPVTVGAEQESAKVETIDGVRFTFKVESIDRAGNSVLSGCSNPIDVDRDGPQTSRRLRWDHGSPTRVTGQLAMWSLPAPGEVAMQTFRLHRGTSCDPATIVAGTTRSDIPIAANASAPVTLADKNTYTFSIELKDLAGNRVFSCSSPMTIDSRLPAEARNLDWTRVGPIVRTGALTAKWTPSNSDIKEQVVIFYQGLNPETQEGCQLEVKRYVIGPDEATQVFAGSDGKQYTFRVLSVDDDGFVAESACARHLQVDVSGPARPEVLGWDEASPSSATTVHASWTPSESEDLASQKIIFYSRRDCDPDFTIGLPVSLSERDSSYAITGSNGSSFNYQIVSVDRLGNESISDCSVNMTIDTGAPNRANNLRWAERQANNGRATALWVPSSSPDVVSQEVRVFRNTGTCTEAAFAGLATIDDDEQPNPALKARATFRTERRSGFYRFVVISTDSDNNRRQSECSSAIRITNQ